MVVGCGVRVAATAVANWFASAICVAAKSGVVVDVAFKAASIVAATAVAILFADEVAIAISSEETGRGVAMPESGVSTNLGS